LSDALRGPMLDSGAGWYVRGTAAELLKLILRAKGSSTISCPWLGRFTIPWSIVDALLRGH
jgi:hypothetical protein